VVLINKRDVPVTVAVQARDHHQFAFGRVWQLTADAPTPVAAANLSLPVTNAGVITLPARSATMLVLMPPL